MLGAISTKSGLPQRIGNFIVSNVGFSYSRILLGLIITDFLLTFIVPTGTGRVVILAAIAIGLIKVFSVPRQLERGARDFPDHHLHGHDLRQDDHRGRRCDHRARRHRRSRRRRGHMVSWFFAFLPAALITIVLCWAYTIWMFPPR